MGGPLSRILHLVDLIGTTTSLASGFGNQVVCNIVSYVPSIHESIFVVFGPTLVQIICDLSHNGRYIVHSSFPALNISGFDCRAHAYVDFLWHPLLYGVTIHVSEDYCGDKQNM